jgi:hypothetical protein
MSRMSRLIRLSVLVTKPASYAETLPCFEYAPTYVMGQLYDANDKQILARLGTTAAPDYEAIGKDADGRQGGGRQDECGGAMRKTSVNFG